MSESSNINLSASTLFGGTDKNKTAMIPQCKEYPKDLPDKKNIDSKGEHNQSTKERESKIPHVPEHIIVSTNIEQQSRVMLSSYLAHSLSGVIEQKLSNGKSIYNLVSITNNVINNQSFTKVIPLIDTTELSLYQVFFMEYESIVCIDRYGLLSVVPKFERRTFYERDIISINNAVYSLPIKSENNYLYKLNQVGKSLTISENETQFFVNCEFGTLIGFTLEVVDMTEGIIKMAGVEKKILGRLSPDLLLVRNLQDNTEEVVSRLSKLVFKRSEVEIVGGVLFVRPNEYSDSWITFVPQELRFGHTKTFKDSNIIELENGVYFKKEHLLFSNTGLYVQLGKEGLEDKNSYLQVCSDGYIFCK